MRLVVIAAVAIGQHGARVTPRTVRFQSPARAKPRARPARDEVTRMVFKSLGCLNLCSEASFFKSPHDISELTSYVLSRIKKS